MIKNLIKFNTKKADSWREAVENMIFATSNERSTLNDIPRLVVKSDEKTFKLDFDYPLKRWSPLVADYDRYLLESMYNKGYYGEIDRAINSLARSEDENPSNRQFIFSMMEKALDLGKSLFQTHKSDDCLYEDEDIAINDEDDDVPINNFLPITPYHMCVKHWPFTRRTLVSGTYTRTLRVPNSELEWQIVYLELEIGKVKMKGDNFLLLHTILPIPVALSKGNVIIEVDGTDFIQDSGINAFESSENPHDIAMEVCRFVSCSEEPICYDIALNKIEISKNSIFLDRDSYMPVWKPEEALFHAMSNIDFHFPSQRNVDKFVQTIQTYLHAHKIFFTGYDGGVGHMPTSTHGYYNMLVVASLICITMLRNKQYQDRSLAPVKGLLDILMGNQFLRHRLYQLTGNSSYDKISTLLGFDTMFDNDICGHGALRMERGMSFINSYYAFLSTLPEMENVKLQNIELYSRKLWLNSIKTFLLPLNIEFFRAETFEEISNKSLFTIPYNYGSMDSDAISLQLFGGISDLHVLHLPCIISELAVLEVQKLRTSPAYTPFVGFTTNIGEFKVYDATDKVMSLAMNNRADLHKYDAFNTGCMETPFSDIIMLNIPFKESKVLLLENVLRNQGGLLKWIKQLQVMEGINGPIFVTPEPVAVDGLFTNDYLISVNKDDPSQEISAGLNCFSESVYDSSIIPHLSKSLVDICGYDNSFTVIFEEYLLSNKTTSSVSSRFKQMATMGYIDKKGKKPFISLNTLEFTIYNEHKLSLELDQDDLHQLSRLVSDIRAAQPEVRTHYRELTVKVLLWETLTNNFQNSVLPLEPIVLVFTIGEIMGLLNERSLAWFENYMVMMGEA